MSHMVSASAINHPRLTWNISCKTRWHKKLILSLFINNLGICSCCYNLLLQIIIQPFPTLIWHIFILSIMLTRKIVVFNDKCFAFVVVASCSFSICWLVLLIVFCFVSSTLFMFVRQFSLYNSIFSHNPSLFLTCKEFNNSKPSNLTLFAMLISLS